MNTHDRLDDQLIEHLRTDAPRQAPDHLLEATMNRISSTPQGGAGLFARPAVRLLAAAAVLLLAVAAGTQFAGLIGPPTGDDASPSPSASASASPSAPVSEPSTEASAEPSATPVAVGPDDTLLSFIQRCDVEGPIVGPSVTILGDGRVIWYRLNEDESSTLSVRQLNGRGLTQVVDAVTTTDLFDADGTYRLVRRPGTPEPPGHGLCTWDFAWSGGDAPVRVSSTMWLGDEEEAAYYEPAPERLALHDLAINVQDPEAWIDASGWADPEAAPFAPLTYLVLVTSTVAEAATLDAPDVDAVTWPFEDGPDTFGEPTGEEQQRCGIADAAAIETLANELAAAGLEQFEHITGGPNVTLPWAARGAAVDVLIYPQRPDREPPCGGSETLDG
jgi:hypothetical protein